MVSSFSLFTVALGAAIAHLTERVSARMPQVSTETMETAAGFLLIGGFAAIGCALPMI